MNYYLPFFVGALGGFIILNFIIELFLKKIYYKKRYKISVILTLIIISIVFKLGSQYEGAEYIEHFIFYIIAAVVVYFIKLYIGNKIEEKKHRFKPNIEKKLNELNKLKEKGEVDEADYKDLKKKILEKELIK